MSRKKLEPKKENSDIKALKAVARAGSRETIIRCHALQMLLVDIPREQVCLAMDVTERSLQTWIALFNESGADALIVNKRSGRTVIIGKEKEASLTDLIDNPQKAGRDFWTAKAFHGYLADEYAIDCSYSTVVRFFHNQGYSLKVPQPWPDRQDEKQREQFRMEVSELLKDQDVDLWFADESGFEGDPRPRRRWDKKGKKTRITKNGDHIRMNVMGMVCPRTGEFFAIEVSHSDTDTFQAFLAEAGKSIEFKRKRNILILDNAAWHLKKSMNWHGWEPKYLPSYSPDMNPIERIWLNMKAKWFNNHRCKNVGKLLERLDEAILDIINNTEQTKKTVSIGKLF